MILHNMDDLHAAITGKNSDPYHIPLLDIYCDKCKRFVSTTVSALIKDVPDPFICGKCKLETDALDKKRSDLKRRNNYVFPSKGMK